MVQELSDVNIIPAYRLVGVELSVAWWNFSDVSPNQGGVRWDWVCRISPGSDPGGNIFALIVGDYP